VQRVDIDGDVLTNRLFQNSNGSLLDVAVATDPTTDTVDAELSVRFVGGGVNQIVSTQGGAGRSAFRDALGFGALDIAGNSAELSGAPVGSSAYLVTASALDAGGFVPGGVAFCECEFLAWGFWGIDASAPLDRSERIHLGQWAAGEVLTSAAIAALDGAATYNGHAIATVNNGASVYSAVGSFAMTVDFDNPAASFYAIDNFDGGSFTGNGLVFGAVGGLNIYDGVLSGQGVHDFVDGTMRGAFMAGADSPAAETGAHWAVSNGLDYEASGIIAATSVE